VAGPLTVPRKSLVLPMVLPALGGILMANKVIDLLLPVRSFYVCLRRWERLRR
jgi:hypothetical protein